jgi:hypothetical protein
MTLREAQEIFTKHVAYLLGEIFHQGYTCTLGEVYRSDEQAWINALPPESKLQAKLHNGMVTEFDTPVGGKGIRKSLHRSRLAVDINLFKDGAYLSHSASHKEFGILWESWHEMFRWGGNFRDAVGRPKPDGNHYEMNYE